MTQSQTPTDRWLACVQDDLPPLDGPSGTAERLLLLLHYGIDWQSGWIVAYRGTYWDRILPDRVFLATYRGAELRRWWREVADAVESQPRCAAERLELAQLLRAPSLPVLEVLRAETEPLLLRTRITADAVRRTRTHRHERQDPA